MSGEAWVGDLKSRLTERLLHAETEQRGEVLME